MLPVCNFRRVQCKSQNCSNRRFLSKEAFLGRKYRGVPWSCLCSPVVARRFGLVLFLGFLFLGEGEEVRFWLWYIWSKVTLGRVGPYNILFTLIDTVLEGYGIVVHSKILKLARSHHPQRLSVKCSIFASQRSLYRYLVSSLSTIAVLVCWILVCRVAIFGSKNRG